ncbi:hypothetical protein [Pseudobutyrivibrio sp. UC1225]|uniref:hypothetical protein n=1 Tax=Pseudobutyrivibrio sp. UC1225 TaxID=1798185 RepID=UPI000B80F94A|nr:hypothetical protein [Pseudobutyrivibrio sp. UC1225]
MGTVKGVIYPLDCEKSNSVGRVTGVAYLLDCGSGKAMGTVTGIVYLPNSKRSETMGKNVTKLWKRSKGIGRIQEALRKGT